MHDLVKSVVYSIRDVLAFAKAATRRRGKFSIFCL